MEISLNSLTQVSPGDEELANNKSKVKGKVLIGSGVVGATASQFVVRDPSGKLLLLVDKNNLVIATQKLRLKHRKGIKFNCSIQSPSILGGTVSSEEFEYTMSSFNSSEEDPYLHSKLDIASLSRGINILAPGGAAFSTEHKDIEMLSLKDWKFNSKAGRVSLLWCPLATANLLVSHFFHL